MKLNINSNVQVKPTLGNIANYVLYAVVFWLIKHNLCQNTGKFKEGDLVTYNWKAKYYIDTVYKNERELGIKKITSITKYSDGSEGCDYINLSDGDESGCDVFWVRKCYWWERPHNGI